MKKQFDIIAGPCSAESPEQVMECAVSLAAQGIGTLRAGVWKPRTRPNSFEGAGLPALEWLKAAKKATGMKLAVEVASAAHVQAALEADIDILWIGSRTTTSPFAVQEIADSLKGTGVPVMIKNPINPDVDLWTGAIERLQQAGIENIRAIHRGFSSTQENLLRYAPQWEIPIELRRRMPSLPILCDPSHMAGRREYVGAIAQMALDMNADGLFIEVHPNPEQAKSDSLQQFTPSQFQQVISSLRRHRDIEESDSRKLAPMRSELDELDSQLVEILARRMEIVKRIGAYKHLNNLAILQPQRYQSVSDSVASEAAAKGMDEKFIRSVFETIHAESVRCQLENENNNLK